jgi:hypothetical protein
MWGTSVMTASGENIKREAVRGTFQPCIRKLPKRSITLETQSTDKFKTKSLIKFLMYRTSLQQNDI